MKKISGWNLFILWCGWSIGVFLYSLITGKGGELALTQSWSLAAALLTLWFFIAEREKS